MSKYVLIPDSFKGTLSAMKICAILRDALLQLEPDAQLCTVPVADGGEGTVEAFLQAVGGQRVTAPAHGPYGETITGFYGRLDETTAVVEMAAAAGLPMVGERRNAEETSTYGVGELVRHAVENGATEIILGLGGSATNDGGCGMAAALGVRFLDDADMPFVPVGKTLHNIARIDASGARALLARCRVRVMCDIDNPLCGPEGAAKVFGPQKGADEAMVKRLDAGLKHMANIIRRDLQTDIETLPGAGAAGGMGGGAVAYLGGTLQMGIDTVLDVVQFSAMIRDADLIFTGEGRLDGQSMRGKVVVGVGRSAARQAKPVIALVGGIADDAQAVYSQGITAVFSINRTPLAYEQAILHCEQNLFRTAQDVLRCWKSGLAGTCNHKSPPLRHPSAMAGNDWARLTSEPTPGNV